MNPVILINNKNKFFIVNLKNFNFSNIMLERVYGNVKVAKNKGFEKLAINIIKHLKILLNQLLFSFPKNNKQDNKKFK